MDVKIFRGTIFLTKKGVGFVAFGAKHFWCALCLVGGGVFRITIPWRR